ncbi:MAG: hypothetical protein A3D90_02020 [Sulfuricurvum sp. RIFCSPHIGHO2_02_FULL_43_9]|nr:MAG: hypothetical protein A3D90_02020 [Sulfuricurvum sp. RIFCSPHIGHO2_02_FULL_43_9]
MAFKGLKKGEEKSPVNHFDAIKESDKNSQFGRPIIEDYKKQNQRVQFYISQEMIDALSPIAFQNGCKDVTAYAKKILTDEFNKISKL